MFVLLVAYAIPSAAKQYADSAVYQGINLKLDVGNTVYTLIRSKADLQQYELSLSVDLQKKFYPTMELGYGLGKDEADGGQFKGQGGFTRIGLDINPLKKHRNNNYMLLAGIRIGMAVENYSLSNVVVADSYWGDSMRDYPAEMRIDAWGEVVAGCQVKVAGPFTMGWYARIHFLFTGKTDDHQPYWIPGYGYKDGGMFSFNYYLGWKF